MDHFFYFCQYNNINNMTFSLDCGTLWLELANGNGETKKQSWNSEIFPQKSPCGGFSEFPHYNTNFSLNPANSQTWALKHHVKSKFTHIYSRIFLGNFLANHILQPALSNCARAKIVGLNCLYVDLAFLLESFLNKLSVTHYGTINIITSWREKLWRIERR